MATEKQKKNRNHPGNVANLRPFKPGQSGNPKGRPKGKTLTEEIRAALLTKDPDGNVFRDTIARVIVEEAAAGKFPFVKELLERLDGKVPVRLAGHDGGELPKSYVGFDTEAV